MGADSRIDIVYMYSVFPRIQPAFLLIGSILLVRSGGIAVKGEKSLIAVLNRKIIHLQVFNHPGASKVPGQSDIDGNIHNFTRNYLWSSLSVQPVFFR